LMMSPFLSRNRDRKGYADAAVMPRSVGLLLVTLGGGAGSSA
jgi:hypothetical protein